jgi:hypothetical protein
MKGLVARPSAEEWNSHFAFLIQSLPESPSVTDLKALARGIDYARLDPRGAELLVTRLACDWEKIPSGDFAEAILRVTTWLQALGVILEFVSIGAKIGSTGGPPLKGKKQDALRQWCQSLLLLCKIQPQAGCEQFFFGNRAFGGKAAFDDALYSLSPYLKWGYISQEVPFNKASRWQGGVTLLPERTRRLRLKEWLVSRKTSGGERLPPLTVESYRRQMGGWVSIRQAQLDLSRVPRLRAFGKTRGRRYSPG